tara:strand:+ start:281 stop:619 length:339 start_codon:yes stop_codon:yes gene_type:complete
MKTISVNTYTTYGISGSVDYNLPNEFKRTILKVLMDIRTNPLIEECQINGSEIWGDVKLYDSTIDDNDRQEIEGGGDEFRSDVQRIIIKKHGEIVFKAYSKWSDDVLTFEIE